MKWANKCHMANRKGPRTSQNIVGDICILSIEKEDGLGTTLVSHLNMQLELAWFVRT